jgi:hypothetical protein
VLKKAQNSMFLQLALEGLKARLSSSEPAGNQRAYS